MDENLHGIDDLFRSALDGHRDAPPPALWDAVESGLDRAHYETIKGRYNNLKRLVAVLLIVLAGFIGYTFIANKRQPGGSGKSLAVEKANQVKGTESGQPGVTNEAANNAVSKQPIVHRSNDTTAINETVRQPESGVDKPSVAVAQAGQPGGQIGSAPSNRVNGNPPQPDHSTGTLQQRWKRRDANFTNNNPNRASHTRPDVQPSDRIAAGYQPLPVYALVPVELAEQAPVALNSIASGGIKSGMPHLNLRVPFPVSAIAKTVPATRKKAGGLSIALFYGPQFAFNRLKDDRREGRHNDRDAIRRDEQEAVTITAGILAEKRLGARLSVQTGLGILKKKTEIGAKQLYARLDNDGRVKYRFDCSSGFTFISPKNGIAPVVGDSITTSASASMLEYLFVPLVAKYNISKGPLTLSPSIGMAFNLLLKQKIETGIETPGFAEKHSTQSINGLKNFYMSGLAALTLEYRLGKKLSVSLTPGVNLAFDAVNKEAAVKAYHNAFGVAGALHIRL